MPCHAPRHAPGACMGPRDQRAACRQHAWVLHDHMGWGTVGPRLVNFADIDFDHTQFDIDWSPYKFQDFLNTQPH